MENKKPSATETADYLKTLGWDASKWTVLTEEEWQPLTQVSGYQNNMFDAVKDPEGRKAYGKNARIVERTWMNKNMASVANADLPEPPAVPKPPVPEKLQEIADASPNVVIASVPKPPAIPEAPKVPTPPVVPPVEKEAEITEVKETEWPSFVKTRAANLISKGWKFHSEDKEILLPPVEGDSGVAYEDLETFENEEWTELLKKYDKPTEPTAEEIKAAQDKAKADRDKVEADRKAKEQADIEEKARKASEERQAKNEEIRKKKEAENAGKGSGNGYAESLAMQDQEASKAEQAAHEELEGQEFSGKTVEEAEKDFKGKVIDEKTIEVEMEVVEANEKGEIKLTQEQAEVFKNDIASEMTTGDQGGLFDALAKVGFGQPKLFLSLQQNGKYTAEITFAQDEIDMDLAFRLMKDGSKLKKKK